MKINELYPDFRSYLLGMKGVHEENGVFCLASKPFAAIYEDSFEITAKADYNETIRILHGSINESRIFGERWNSITADPTLPYEVITDMADRGYRMTYASLPKQVQREIEEYYYG